MGYSKLYYALLNLKKVVIFACFNVTISIEFELVYFVNWIFLLHFFAFLIGSHIFCLFAIETRCLFLFFCVGFIVIDFHSLMLKGPTMYKTLIFALDFLIVVTFTKNLQMFCATNKCDSD